MSTELTTIDETKFLALRPGSEVAEALEANLSTGETVTVGDLTTVPIPSQGVTQFTFEDLEGEISTPTITGALVYYCPFGVLWPYEEPSDNAMPLLVTHDLRVAHKKGDEYGDLDREAIEACRLSDGTYDWQKLPYNKYGSAARGKGKRCKEQRYMCILREGDTFPLLVRISPGSLRNVTSFIKKLTVPYWRTVVELSLEKTKNDGGQPFSRVKIRLVEKLDATVGAAIKSTYTERLEEAVQMAAEQSAVDSGQDDLE
jgi:hypothetical protein